MSLRCLIGRHKWRFKPFEAHTTDATHRKWRYENAVCARCGKTTWAHGRN